MYQKLLYSPAASRCFKDLNVVRRETCRKIKGKKKYKKIHYQLHKQCKAYHFTPNVSNKAPPMLATKQGHTNGGTRLWEENVPLATELLLFLTIEPFSWGESHHRIISTEKKGVPSAKAPTLGVVMGHGPNGLFTAQHDP